VFKAIPGASHTERTFEELFAYDIVGLAAHLANIIIDDDQNNNLMARRYAEAQSLLDLLQAVRSYTPSFLDPTDTRQRSTALGLLH
jgi:hypothetical protein